MESIDSITQFLGGARTFSAQPQSDIDFIKMIRQGFPVRAVACAAKALSLTEEQTFSWLKISKRTAARRKETNERLRGTESERLLRLARVASAAANVFGNREKSVRWLKQPNRALGNEAPYNLLDTDIGFQNVLDVLQRIEFGVLS